MSETLDKLHFPAYTAPTVTTLMLLRHLMVILESIPAASAARSFATSHLLTVFPHSSRDNVKAGPRSGIKDDSLSINLGFLRLSLEQTAVE